MKSLRKPGQSTPRPFSILFPRHFLRRFVLPAALAAVGTAQMLSPASAFQMRMGYRIGYQNAAPVSGPLFAEGVKSVAPMTDPVTPEEDNLTGMIRANSIVPLTIALGGGGTGEAQMQATLDIADRTTTYTRAVHLTGKPQTIRMTLSLMKLTAGDISRYGRLTLQLLQNGRSLAQAKSLVMPNTAPTSYNVLALSGPGTSLQFLRNADSPLRNPASILIKNHNAKTFDWTQKDGSDLSRLFAATPESLPESAQAFDGIDAVVLTSDYPLSQLEPAQKTALREYVRQGGRLIAVGSRDDNSEFGQYLRESFGTNWKSTASPEDITSQSAASVTAGFDGAAAVYGAGTVFGVSNAALPSASAATSSGVPGSDYYSFRESALSKLQLRLWTFLLGGDEIPIYSPKAARAINATQDYANNSNVRNMLAGRQASKTLPFPLISGFLLVYIVLIVPVNYLVLKRLDRRELAWVTAPALVFLFSGVSYAAASAIKGGHMTVNRAVVYEAFANTNTATGFGQFSIYSTRRAAYDISIGDPKDAKNPCSRTVPLEAAAYGSNANDSSVTIAQDASTTLQNVTIAQYDTRSFAVPMMDTLGGGIEARVKIVQDGSGSGHPLRYTLTNHTKYPLHDCSVLVGWYSVTVGELAPGDTTQVDVPDSRVLTTRTTSCPLGNYSPGNDPHYVVYPNRTGTAGGEETPEETRQAIKWALQMNGDFMRHSKEFSGNNTIVSDGTQQSVCGFTGWFDAKTLDVRVDGKPAAGEQENLLFVHLPLPANTDKNLTVLNDGLSSRRWIPDANDYSAAGGLKTQNSHAE